MYKFAIVGCGRIAHKHAENIAVLGKLQAVCDIISDRADALASEYGSKAYYSLDDLLKNEQDIDIICVCSPNGLHAEHAIKSLQAGKHVLCEKPMCITSVAAWQMIETAHFFRKKLFVVKQNRYNEPVQMLKKIMDDNGLGKIYNFQVNCFWNRPQNYYTGDWKGTKSLDGGILYTQFSHFIDLIYWLLGDVNKVKGFAANYRKLRNMELEDSGVAVLEMKNGTMGTLNYTVNCYKRNVEGSFTVLGEKGSVKVGGQYLNTLEIFDVENYDHPSIITSSPPNQYGFYEGSMSNHDKVYEELIPSLKGNGNLLEAKDAVKTIEIIEKIYASSESLAI